MKNKIGIFGVGGMAEEAGEIAKTLGMMPIFISKDEKEYSSDKKNIITENDLKNFQHLPCVIAIGNSKIRKKIATKFDKKIKFSNLVHPSATFGCSKDTFLINSKGLIINAGARISGDVVCGDFVIINYNSVIHHGTVLGNYVMIASNATILGNVEICSGAWIGAGAIINQGNNHKKKMVGKNTIIGSGSVVTRDCDEDCTYIGAPARKF